MERRAAGQENRHDEHADSFLGLTPERVLAAVEAAGLTTTGLCYPLNSFENRVYEVELGDHSRVVAKFYRPGRWHRGQILEEHACLAGLDEAEIPVCTLRPFPDGRTLATVDGLHYALSDRRGGRAPDELTPALAHRLGTLVGRMHTVLAVSTPSERPRLDAQRYVHRVLAWLVRHQTVPRHLATRYHAVAAAIAGHYDERAAGVAVHRIHADLHLGNVLLRDGVLRLLDFDDLAIGPAVQDLWLAIPGRDDESLRLRQTLIDGYETFRTFDRAELALIEPLRGLRLVRYAGWLARRWHDPAFRVGWPQFGTDAYWLEQTEDLEAQCHVIENEAPSDAHAAGGPDRPAETEAVLTNKDYFFDWEGD